MTSQNFRLPTMALLLTGLIGLLSVSSAGAAATPGKPPAMPVTVMQPEIRQMAEYDEFTGRFEAYQEVEIRARVSGYLEKIHFQDGQWVKVGDPLFSIDPRPYQAAVDEAEAELARAESQRYLAAQEMTRAKRLVQKKAMSQEELDSRAASLTTAQANIAAAKAALQTAQLNLEYTEIHAPVSGRISDRKIDIGNLIQAGGSQVLTSIVAQEPVYFVFDVAEGDFLKYRRRMVDRPQSSLTDGAFSVRVRLLDEDDFVHVGKLNFIDNRLDKGTSTIRLRAIFEHNNDGLLLPGLFGRIQLPVSEEKETLLVPDKAIVSDMGNKLVMTVDPENKVVPKPVRLGNLHQGMRVIKSGLEAGDRVVIEGLLRTRPGAVVAPHEAQAAVEGGQ